MDLFVHPSGPFGGPFFVWGGSSEPGEPPLATALLSKGDFVGRMVPASLFTHEECSQSESVFLLIFTGIMTAYVSKQIVVWFLFHSLAMFWSTYFPFSYREAKANGRLRAIFIATILIGVLGPLIALVFLKDGFYASNFFSSFCTARNPTILFSVSTVPLSLLLWINSSLFTLIMWKIFKVSPKI